MFKNNKKVYSLTFAIIALIFFILSFLNVSQEGNIFKKEKTEDLIQDAKNVENKELPESNFVLNTNIQNEIRSEAKLDSKNEYNSSGKFFIQDKEIQIEFNEGEILLNVMNRLKNSGQINFNGKEFADMGFLVQEINGKTQNPKENLYWFYYVNGDSANVGISNYKLKNNDSIRWKLEAYE